MAILLILLLISFFSVGYLLSNYRAKLKFAKAMAQLNTEMGKKIAKLQASENRIKQAIAQLEVEYQQLDNDLAQKKVEIIAQLEQSKEQKQQQIKLDLIKELEDMKKKMETDLNSVRKNSEKEILFKRQEALKQIEQWTSDESERLTKKLEDEYINQYEIIQSELKK